MKECFYYYRSNPDSMTNSREKGFDWNSLRLLADVWKKYLNSSYDFSAQFNRYMCFDLFTITKSYLQTNRPYPEVKRIIKRELNAPDFRNYVIHAEFDTLSLAKVRQLLLRFQLIRCIKLLIHCREIQRKTF